MIGRTAVVKFVGGPFAGLREIEQRLVTINGASRGKPLVIPGRFLPPTLTIRDVTYRLAGWWAGFAHYRYAPNAVALPSAAGSHPAIAAQAVRS